MRQASRCSRLLTGRMKGAEHINLQPGTKSGLVMQHDDCLTMRYYPAAPKASAAAATRSTTKSVAEDKVAALSRRHYLRQRAHLEHHAGVTDLSHRLCLSFVTPVASTSRSSVLRHRMVRRLREVMRQELVRRHAREGAAALPDREMHLVMTPRGTDIAHMPWALLQSKVIACYDAVRGRFERQSPKQQDKMAAAQHVRGFPHRPKIERQRSMIEELDKTPLPHVAAVADSDYTRAAGGVKQLVRHMLGKTKSL